jgi:hypothetical protein
LLTGGIFLAFPFEVAWLQMKGHKKQHTSCHLRFCGGFYRYLAGLPAWEERFSRLQ